MGCMLSKPRRKEQGLEGEKIQVAEEGSNGQHLVSLTSSSYALLHYSLNSSTAESSFSSSSSVAHALSKFEKFELASLDIAHSKPSHTDLGNIDSKLLREAQDFGPVSQSICAATAAEPELIDVLLIMKDLQEEEEEVEAEPVIISTSLGADSRRRLKMADNRDSFSFHTVEEADGTDCLGKMTTTRKESGNRQIEDLKLIISLSSASNAEVSQGTACSKQLEKYSTKPANSKLLPWPIIPTKEPSLVANDCIPLFEPDDLVEAYERALDNFRNEEWLETVGNGRSCLQSLFTISGSREERDEDEDEDDDPKPKHVLSEPPLQVQEEGVVLYTTSLQGIRKTFEDSNNLRTLVHSLGVRIHERDLSMHPPFRKELASLLGSGAPVSLPQLFINGKHIGGADEAAQLSEQGKLAELVAGLPLQKRGEMLCEYGCGGIRFIPCLECSGSCKILDEETNRVIRCPECNENGLIQCPICT